jgi:hypothetical protein
MAADGAGRTSSPLPQQQQAAESGVEEGDPARRQMEYLVSQIQGIKGQLWEGLKAWISADDDPGRCPPGSLASLAFFEFHFVVLGFLFFACNVKSSVSW